MGFVSWLRAAAGKLVGSVREVDPEPPGTQERIGGSLRPEDVSQIFIEADLGYMQRLVDLADESRQKDCHLQSILFTRESSVARLPYQVTPASPRRRDKKIAAWVQEWLDGFGADYDGPEPRDLPNLISHLQGAVYYGYAVAEIIWEKRGGREVPVGAEPIHARRFCFEPTRSKLHFWDPMGRIPYPGLNLLEKYPAKFIQHQPRITGGVATREGLMRVLLWAALFRNWGFRDWLRLAELAWKPWRIGKYIKKDAKKEDVRALRRALEQLTSTGVALLPDSVEFVIEWAKSSGRAGGGEHAQLAAFFAAEMSKAVLGATLAVDQGRVGSQALGRVHEGRLASTCEWDAMADAAVIRRLLVAPAVRRNWGAGVGIPGLRLLTEDAADFEATARGFLYLRQAGLRVAAKDPRDKLGLSEPLDGEEVLGDVDTTAPKPPEKPAPPEQPAPEPDDGTGDDTADDTEDMPEAA